MFQPCFDLMGGVGENIVFGSIATYAGKCSFNNSNSSDFS